MGGKEPKIRERALWLKNTKRQAGRICKNLPGRTKGIGKSNTDSACAQRNPPKHKEKAGRKQYFLPAFL